MLEVWPRKRFMVLEGVWEVRRTRLGGIENSLSGSERPS